MSDRAAVGDAASGRDGAEKPAAPERDPDAADLRPAPTVEKRLLWVVVVMVLLGAAALWGSSRLAWIDLPAGLVSAQGQADRLTGADLLASQVPIALLMLATVAAILALRGWSRRLLGALLLLIGGWVLYETLRGMAHEVSGFSWLPGHADTDAVFEQVFWGPAAAAAAFVLIAGAGVLLLWRGHRMPGMGAKYSAPGTGRAAQDPDSDLWNALSDGEDPTVR